MQLAHIEVGDTPTDLTAGLAAGLYIAQVRDQPGTVGALYASRATAPTVDVDYFAALGGEFFTFIVGIAEPTTWAKSALAGSSFTLALALVE